MGRLDKKSKLKMTENHTFIYQNWFPEVHMVVLREDTSFSLNVSLPCSSFSNFLDPFSCWPSFILPPHLPLTISFFVGFREYLSHQPLFLPFLDNKDRLLGCSHCLG